MTEPADSASTREIVEDEFVLYSGLLSWEPVLAELMRYAEDHGLEPQATRSRRLLSVKLTIRVRGAAEDVSAFARFIQARRWQIGHLPSPPSP